MAPNHSVERTGASRSDNFPLVRQWRLAPAADAGRLLSRSPDFA